MATFDLKMYYQKLKLTCCSISLEMKPYCTVLPQMSSVQCVVVCGELCVLSGVQKETNQQRTCERFLFIPHKSVPTAYSNSQDTNDTHTQIPQSFTVNSCTTSGGPV